MEVNANDMNEITRILSGEATEKERELFYNTLEADPDKKQAFDIMEKEWIAASNAMLYKSLDVDAAWQRQKNEFLDLTENKSRVSIGFWKWAAVFVAIAGLAYYFIAENNSPVDQFATYKTGALETLDVTLADGSEITLNQNSTLEYQFTESTRKVNFSGEAYFKITPDASHPFFIEMEGAYIKVIGTAFNVREDASTIDVLVEEGVVEFGLNDRSGKTLLEAGSSGKLSGTLLSKSEVSELNAIAWYTKNLVFNQTPLNVVLNDISNTYHINFQYDGNKLNTCRLTADFTNEELSNVLETLHSIFKVDFQKKEHTYIVTGESCE